MPGIEREGTFRLWTQSRRVNSSGAGIAGQSSRIADEGEEGKKLL